MEYWAATGRDEGTQGLPNRDDGWSRPEITAFILTIFAHPGDPFRIGTTRESIEVSTIAFFNDQEMGFTAKRRTQNIPRGDLS